MLQTVMVQNYRVRGKIVGNNGELAAFEVCAADRWILEKHLGYPHLVMIVNIKDIRK